MFLEDEGGPTSTGGLASPWRFTPGSLLANFDWGNNLQPTGLTPFLLSAGGLKGASDKETNPFDALPTKLSQLDSSSIGGGHAPVSVSAPLPKIDALYGSAHLHSAPSQPDSSFSPTVSATPSLSRGSSDQSSSSRGDSPASTNLDISLAAQQQHVSALRPDQLASMSMPASSSYMTYSNATGSMSQFELSQPTSLPVQSLLSSNTSTANSSPVFAQPSLINSPPSKSTLLGKRKQSDSTPPKSNAGRKRKVVDDEEARRQDHLERNRVAACKSRQKKKAWMEQLEK